MLLIEGATARLHKNSICQMFTADSGNALCSILAYDGEKKKWRVQGFDLASLASDGTEHLVAEESLQLCFSLLPSSCGKVRAYQEIAHEAEQGACGRGLMAMQDIKSGSPIFEEPPLIVAHESSISRSCTVQWRFEAYKALLAKASREDTAGVWSRALAAFESLGTLDAPIGICEAARQIVAHENEAAGNADRELGERQRQAQQRTQHVQEVLMRYVTNQHGWHCGSSSHNPAFAGTALYAFSSRANHSCAPSMLLSLKEDICKLYGRPFDAEKEGGVIIFTALRDIKAGEPLTYSCACASNTGIARALSSPDSLRSPRSSVLGSSPTVG